MKKKAMKTQSKLGKTVSQLRSRAMAETGVLKRKVAGAMRKVKSAATGARRSLGRKMATS